MNDVKRLPEAEDFGPQNSWRLLSRSIIDDQRTTVRAMGVQGRGVFVQTSRQARDGEGWGPASYDEPVLCDRTLMLEYMEVSPSEILDEAGNPTSVSIQCIGRELVSVDMAKTKFPQSKNKGKNGRPGQFDHLDLRPGVVLTMEQRPMPVRLAPPQEAAQA